MVSLSPGAQGRNRYKQQFHVKPVVFGKSLHLLLGFVFPVCLGQSLESQ